MTPALRTFLLLILLLTGASTNVEADILGRLTCPRHAPPPSTQLGTSTSLGTPNQPAANVAQASKPAPSPTQTTGQLPATPGAAAPSDSALPPIRIVSQTVGTDEFLLALAEPSQITALSHLADDPMFSGISTEVHARKIPMLTKDCDAEGILKFRPTLVLLSDYSRPELVEQIRRTGTPTLLFSRYNTLEETYAALRTLAQAIDPAAQNRAEQIIADCRRRLSALQQKLATAKPVRVIAPSIYGAIPGANTTFQDICDNTAAQNLATTLGRLNGHQPPPNEKMLTWPIDKVILAGNSTDEALAPYLKLPPYLYLPAIREKRVALLELWQLSCISHLRIQTYEHLARQLHPALFNNK